MSSFHKHRVGMLKNIPGKVFDVSGVTDLVKGSDCMANCIQEMPL